MATNRINETTSKLFSKDVINAMISALDIDKTDSYVTDGGVEVIGKTYKLYSKLENGLDTKTINDSELIEHTDRILALNGLDELTGRLRCYELYKASQHMDSIGMKYTDYANKVCGIARSSADNYRRVGEYFIGEDGNCMVKGIPNLPFSYYQEFLSFVKDHGMDKLVEAFEPNNNGCALLYKGMSKSQMKESLSKYVRGILDIHGSQLLTKEERKLLTDKEKAERNIKKDVTAKTAESVKTDSTVDTSTLSNTEKIQYVVANILETYSIFTTIEMGEKEKPIVSAYKALISAIKEYVK